LIIDLKLKNENLKFHAGHGLQNPAYRLTENQKHLLIGGVFD